MVTSLRLRYPDDGRRANIGTRTRDRVLLAASDAAGPVPRPPSVRYRCPGQALVATLALSSICTSGKPRGFLVPGPRTSPTCAKTDAQIYVVPADARVRLSYFPFNETLRQNVLDAVTKFDFYASDDYDVAPVPEFGQPAAYICGEFTKINGTSYASDHAFNTNVFDVVNGMNDGHTGWYTYCHRKTFENLLPAPASSARVVTIEGLPAYSYVSYITDTVSGSYLDHGERVNSMFCNYRNSGGNYSQRFGDLRGPVFPDLTNLTMEVIFANGTESVMPYLTGYLEEPFTETAS
ncbi:hypothetical protein EVJ58_g9096 [Rhodofomes roseus]|uniref:Uncharacterized protein n=1 Tax=Rhodofomes roseus TaxID=34475 RepID=A0A4Y9XV62_9APHY|nr:hypothetical protein EVJ58_g9096 [Rhodofomes roseus]